MSYETKILPSGIVVENRPGYQCKCWYIEGTYIIHNEGELAIEYTDGDRYWLQHGKLHRLDGPAIEYANGYKRYYIDDVLYNEEDYWNFLYLKDHPELEPFI